MKLKMSYIKYFPKCFLRTYNLSMLPKRLDMFYIYVLDSLGGSFKEALLKIDYHSRYANLVRGLDIESKHIVDIVLLRIHNYPEEKYGRVLLSRKEDIVGRLLDVEKISQKEIRKSFKKYTLPTECSHEDSVFYAKHGLRNFDTSTISYVQQGDFVDCGAFIGDSLLVFSEYCKQKIYAIEMSASNISVMNHVLELNSIPSESYKILQYGLIKPGDKKTAIIDSNGDMKSSIEYSNGKIAETIECATLDEIVREHKIAPKFIKADIEGAGWEFIQGAMETISTFRPVLALAIYHNPTEFFEIKTFLENRFSDYTFKIDKLTSSVLGVHHHSEVYLFAFPKEVYNS